MKTVIGKLEVSFVHLLKELGVSLEHFDVENIAAVDIKLITTDNREIVISNAEPKKITVEDIEDDEDDE